MSLREIFAEAPHLRDLAGDLPTQAVANLRLLLAILHAAVDGPGTEAEWRALWRADSLPVDKINAYLDAYRERFDLFSRTSPFMQTPGLETVAGNPDGVEVII